MYASEATTGTAIGAALLTGIGLEVPMNRIDGQIEGLAAYAEQWRKSAEEGSTFRKG